MATDRDSSSRKLAVAVIVKNEQDVLIETLQSVQTVADRIDVLDTGSTDRTPMIAATLGANVVTRPWGEDFSAARNALWNAIDSDWILWLDAGERLDPSCAESLRRLVDASPDADAVHLVQLVLPAEGDTPIHERKATPRLVPNRNDLRFEGRVRETLAPSMKAAGLGTVETDVRIICHPRRHDEQRKQTVAARNLKLIDLEQASAAGAPPARLLLAKADALADQGMIDEAADGYLQVVRSAEPESLEMLEGYYGLLTTLERDPTQIDREIALGVEALESYPLDTQILCLVGHCLHRKGRTDLAIRSFELAANNGRTMPETWRPSNLQEAAVTNHALALQLAGRWNEAADALDAALARMPGSTSLARHRFSLALHLADEEKAVALSNHLFAHRSERLAVRTAVAGACRAAKCDWPQALELLEQVHAQGMREPFAMRWLAVALLAVNRQEDAQHVLGEWTAVSPDDPELRALLRALNDPVERERMMHASRALSGDAPASEFAISSNALPDGVYTTSTDEIGASRLNDPSAFHRIDPAADEGSFTVLPSPVFISSHSTHPARESAHNRDERK